MENYYFNFKDLFKAPRAAIGPQRIGIAAMGLLLAHAVWLVFSYLALLLNGTAPADVWYSHGLLINPFLFSLSLPAKIVSGTGAAAAVFMLLITNTAVSRASYMLLRGSLFYTWKKAFRFAFGKSRSIAANYIVFMFMISPFIIGGITLSVLGRIPWFGEIVNAMAALIYIFAGLALVFLTLSVFISFVYGPVIFSCAEEDGFGSSVQSLYLTWGQPWRLVLYGTITVFMSITAVLFFAFVLKAGLIIYSNLFMPLMHSMAPILNNALYYIQCSLGEFDAVIRSILGGSGARILYLKQLYILQDLPLSAQISSWIVYLSFLLAGYMAAGYGLAVFNTSLVISFINFSKRLTGTDLLKRDDTEIDEEESDIKIDPKEGDIKYLG